MPQPVSAMICACCSGYNQAVEFTTKHADSSACMRMLTSIWRVNRSPANEPGYIEA
ncbi:hypothetical protein D3C76_1533320 [compost metagenome]